MNRYYDSQTRCKSRRNLNYSLMFMIRRLSRDRFGRHIGSTAQLVISPNARTIHLPTSTAFEDYIASNHRDWFAHVEAIGLDCEPSDIVCISGFTKGSELDLRVETLKPSWSSRSEPPIVIHQEWPRRGAATHTTSDCAGFIEFYRIRYRPTPEDLARMAERRELHSWCSTEGGEDRTVRPTVPKRITGSLIITVGRNTPGRSIEVSTTRTQRCNRCYGQPPAAVQPI